MEIKRLGYYWLDTWVLANVIQLATQDFCMRYLNRKNHPVVQLKEANHKLICSIHNIPTFKAAYHWLGKMREFVGKKP